MDELLASSIAANMMEGSSDDSDDFTDQVYGFEVCVDSAQSALNALEAGAWQLQISKGLAIGGLTPNTGLLKFITGINPDVYTSAIIRPRTGDFVYTEMEHNAMLSDIVDVCRSGANGVVLGCLTEDHDVDMVKCTEILCSTGAMSVTFSRAFDLTRDPRESLECLIDLGFNCVLTSGCRRNCLEGARFIRELMDQAAGRISIIPSGGINPNNLEAILEVTRTRQVNVSANAPNPSIVATYGNGMGKPFGPMHEECCIQKVFEMLTLARQHWGI